MDAHNVYEWAGNELDNVVWGNSGLGPVVRHIVKRALSKMEAARYAAASRLDASELAEFAQTVEDFDDNGETATPYDVLMDWAERGFLDCDHFIVTDKGRAALGGNGIPHFVTPAPLDKSAPKDADHNN